MYHRYCSDPLAGEGPLAASSPYRVKLRHTAGFSKTRFASLQASINPPQMQQAGGADEWSPTRQWLPSPPRSPTRAVGFSAGSPQTAYVKSWRPNTNLTLGLGVTLSQPVVCRPCCTKTICICVPQLAARPYRIRGPAARALLSQAARWPADLSAECLIPSLLGLDFVLVHEARQNY